MGVINALYWSSEDENDHKILKAYNMAYGEVKEVDVITENNNRKNATYGYCYVRVRGL